MRFQIENDKFNFLIAWQRFMPDMWMQSLALSLSLFSSQYAILKSYLAAFSSVIFAFTQLLILVNELKMKLERFLKSLNLCSTSHIFPVKLRSKSFSQ